MTLTEAIKAHINAQVESMLSEIDLDKEVEKYVSKESIRSITEGAIEGEILNQVTKAISMSIRQAILERQPLIDAMTNSKVMALLMGYTQFIDKVENDVNKNVEEKQTSVYPNPAKHTMIIKNAITVKKEKQDARNQN